MRATLALNHHHRLHASLFAPPPKSSDIPPHDMTKMSSALSVGAGNLGKVLSGDNGNGMGGLDEGRDLLVVPETQYNHQIEHKRREKEERRKRKAAADGQPSGGPSEGSSFGGATKKRKIIPKPEDLTLLLNTIKNMPEGIEIREENFVKLAKFQNYAREILDDFLDDEDDDDDDNDKTV